jgi:hypothetical protein
VSETVLRTLLPDSTADVPLFLRSVSTRVNDDSRELGIVVCVTMEKQQTRLRRDRDANLISEVETAGALKMFLGEKYLDMPLELTLIALRQSSVYSNIVLENVGPFSRKRFCL